MRTCGCHIHMCIVCSTSLCGLGQLTDIACIQCIHHDAATIDYSYSYFAVLSEIRPVASRPFCFG